MTASCKPANPDHSHDYIGTVEPRSAIGGSEDFPIGPTSGEYSDAACADGIESPQISGDDTNAELAIVDLIGQ